MKPPLPDPTGADFEPQPLVDFSRIDPDRFSTWMLRNAWWLAPIIFMAGLVYGSMKQ